MESISNDTLKSALLKGGYISEEDLVRAEKYIKENGGSISEYLFSRGIINKDIAGQAMAESFGMDYVNLEKNTPEEEVLLNMPKELAQSERIIILNESEDEVVFATDKTSPKATKEIINLFPKKTISFKYALPESINSALLKYRADFSSRFKELIERKDITAPVIIEEILDEAINLNVSDIHFEPKSKETSLRFRIDGVLHEVGFLSKDFYSNILNRIKVLANLRIDEHSVPQDGAVRYESKNNDADLRVSIIPVIDGEKIVIRILSHYIHSLGLSELGLSDKDRETIEKASKEPFGVILTAGPTGSGKTTTLYAMVNLLNSTKVNITTIEDPVEYRIDGVNQIQINTDTGLTFGRGLRSIVRQDPNVILVGEIRDIETAEISINAGLTGHLVLSTFHANNSASVIPRLLDMGVEGFLLGSTIKLIVSQRLVRKLCEECRFSSAVSTSDLESVAPGISKHFKSKSINIYKSKGCNACHKTGFKGRIGLYEVLPVSKKFAEAVGKNSSEQELWKIAKSEGVKSIFEDGIEKVLAGQTSLEELVRVIPNSFS